VTHVAHDPRCERSTSKRCRCDCGGRLHGDQASQIDLEAVQRTLAEASDEELLVAIGAALDRFAERSPAAGP
jgi:hypothetical protein